MKGGVWLLLYSAFFNEVFVAIILLYPPREIGLGLVIQNLSVRAHGPLIPPPKSLHRPNTVLAYTSAFART